MPKKTKSMPPRKGANYVQRMGNLETKLLVAAMDEAEQRIVDMFECVLHDPEIMGKDTFGEGRIMKIIHGVIARNHLYNRAFDSADVEQDYWQERLDAELREIHKEKLEPFATRHPYIAQQKYQKPRKGWAD